jgi:tRNA-Thr(GGU) m(6)t(6)A37 methyltransferase TsaA
MDITIKPIGIIHSPFHDRREVPRSAREGSSREAVLEVFEGYAEGIRDIREGDEAYVLFHFHKSEGYDLTTLSRKTGTMMGVFSTRSPFRPNGIGLTVVRFVKIEGNRLTFRGVDMLDGTPVVDIKPFDREALCGGG